MYLLAPIIQPNVVFVKGKCKKVWKKEKTAPRSGFLRLFYVNEKKGQAGGIEMQDNAFENDPRRMERKGWSKREIYSEYNWCTELIENRK